MPDTTPTSSSPLTHFDAQGQAHMVDVSAKSETHRIARATVISREPGVLCGRAWFDRCVTVLDPAAEIVWHADDGYRRQALGVRPVCRRNQREK